MPDRHLAHRFWGDRDPQANYQGICAEQDADTAEIKLYDPIDSWGEPFGVSAKAFTDALDALPDTTKSITLRINSPGGEVGDGLAIMNALRSHKAAVNVIVEGRAASAASFIAMAGDTVTMAPQSQMMIHDAAGIGIGNAKDMADYAAFLDKSSDNVAATYAARAGGTVAEWREVMRAETWFNDQEAVDAKLADKVGTTQAPAKAALNRFDLSIFNYAGREQAPEPHTPADQPVTPPTDHKEADTMSDTIPTAGLVKALGLADDADEDTILEAVEAKVKADTALAKAKADLAEAQAKAPTAGSVVVDAQQWDDVKAMAAKGAQASARQSAEDRDATIAKAINDGKLSRNEENVAKLKVDWDADPELTAKRIADMAVLYPVAKVAAGYAGSDDDKPVEVMTEVQAKAIAAQTGVDYRELMSA
jgi:ATP-dependent protease ClpP protease subunit